MATTEAEIDQLVDDLVTAFPPATTDPEVFLGEQFDRGLAFVHFATGEGGLGGTPADQLYAMRKLSKLGAPSAMGRNVIGYGMVAPTIAIHGTPEQKHRYLRPLFTGEEIDIASAGLPLRLMTNDSVYDYEKSNLPAGVWPPTGWYADWVSGMDVFDVPREQSPIEMRWLVYTKTS